MFISFHRDISDKDGQWTASNQNGLVCKGQERTYCKQVLIHDEFYFIVSRVNMTVDVTLNKVLYHQTR